MLAILLGLFLFIRLLARGHQAIEIENLALRQQLAAYRRKGRRPRLTDFDRWFWAGLFLPVERVALGRCVRRAQDRAPVAAGAIPAVLCPTLKSEWPASR
jgi:hypothetical protein